MAHVRTYNPSVRVGNWYEDVALEEDTLKSFLYKRDRGELLSQKSQRFIDTILSKVHLSPCPSGNLMTGSVVMLLNLGDPNPHAKANVYDADVVDSVISAATSTGALSEQTELKSPCDVTGCQTIEPMVKTAFVIMSVNPNDSVMRYGQPFYLKTLDGPGGNLFLKSDVKSFQSAAKKSGNQAVTLTDAPNILCEWIALHHNPLFRMEYEFQPVPANEKVILLHRKTGNCLCVEYTFTSKGPLGREFEISCVTKLTSHKAEKPENIFYIVASVPGRAVKLANSDKCVGDVVEDDPDELVPPSLAPVSKIENVDTAQNANENSDEKNVTEK